MLLERCRPNCFVDGTPCHGVGDPFKASDGYPAGVTWVAVIFPDGKMRPVPMEKVLVGDPGMRAVVQQVS